MNLVPEFTENAVIIQSNRPQFSQIYHDIIDSRILNVSELGMFVTLMRYADKNSMQAFPSQSRLAKDLQISKVTVIKILKSLENKGVLKIQRRLNEKGALTSNLYVIIDDPLQWHREYNELELVKNTKKRPDEFSGILANAEIDTSSQVVHFTNDYSTKPLNEQALSDIDDEENEFSYAYICERFFAKDLAIEHGENKAEMIMRVIYDTLNSSQKQFTIDKVKYSKSFVVQRFLELQYFDLSYALDFLQNYTGTIRHPKAFVRTLLFNARPQKEISIQNKINVNMAKKHS